MILTILLGLTILLAFPQYATSWLMPFHVATGLFMIWLGIKRFRVRKKSQTSKIEGGTGG